MMSCILYIILAVLLFFACALSALTQLSHRRTTDVKELAPQRILHVRILSVCIVVFTLTAFICREGGGFGFLLWARDSFCFSLLCCSCFRMVAAPARAAGSPDVTFSFSSHAIGWSWKIS